MANRFGVLPLVLLGALLGACGVGINGQRTTWRYDGERDVLQILVHFDGIHELETDDDETKGPELIREFVEQGVVMLFGPGIGFSREQLSKTAADEDEPPAARAFARRLAENLSISVVGHFRDGKGRIGAVQYVEISDASGLVKAANAALNEIVLHGEPDPGWELTRARMIPGAKAGRPWLFLDGHALGIEFPAHPVEWSRHRRRFLLDTVGPHLEPEEEEHPMLLPWLTLGPIAVDETAERVRLRLGDPGRPVTMRHHPGDFGKGGLDDVVKEVAPADIDAMLADRLLGRVEEEPAPAIAALLDWGPPEDRIRALLRRAAAAEGEERAAALAKLEALGERWNETIGLPEAPAAGADLESWWEFYAAVLTAPYDD